MRRFILASLTFGVVTWTSLAIASTGEVSFTPTGLRLSVMRITLSTRGDGGEPRSEQVLYTCPRATEAECLVDVTKQSELDAIAAQAASAAVDVGTYDTVSLDLCAPGKSGEVAAPAYVKGTFFVPSESKTYGTEGDASNVTGIREVEDADGGAEYAAIGNWRCTSKRVWLRTPVVVTSGAATSLTVVVDPTLIAFSTPNVSPGMGGCRGQSNGAARGFCVSYPSLVPLVGEGTPELDRFLVAHHRSDPLAIDDSRANGYVVVVRDADGGTPLTAFTRPYYSETSAAASSNNSLVDPTFGGPAYFGETLVESVGVNPDGSIRFVTGGSRDGNAPMFSAFALRDHRGVVDTRDGGAWHYHAIPLP